MKLKEFIYVALVALLGLLLLTAFVADILNASLGWFGTIAIQ